MQLFYLLIVFYGSNAVPIMEMKNIIDLKNNEIQKRNENEDTINNPAQFGRTCELVAHVPGTQKANSDFWNGICGAFEDLTVDDVILVQMGDNSDYFKPTSSMSVCTFLLHNQYTWSTSVDGEYVIPDYHPAVNDPVHNLGGSIKSDDGIYDGRNYISFWGSDFIPIVDRRVGGADYHWIGGCCHYTHGADVDLAAWGRMFDLYILRTIVAPPSTLIAHVPGDQKADTDFWNDVCQSSEIEDLTVDDIVVVHMGANIDYFKPTSSMSLCHFLTNNEYTWSTSIDGNYTIPPYHPGVNTLTHHLGGSDRSEEGVYDGRNYISFWGSNNDASWSIGGCCHERRGADVDDAAWGKEFDLSVMIIPIAPYCSNSDV